VSWIPRNNRFGSCSHAEFELRDADNSGLPTPQVAVLFPGSVPWHRRRGSALETRDYQYELAITSAQLTSIQPPPSVTQSAFVLTFPIAGSVLQVPFEHSPRNPASPAGIRIGHTDSQVAKSC
jgi:hypothetical protein